ncbi:SRPBCC family protein [Aquimarina pacifica]|uniref:SRPBCC family protein n=1 Tax=Aquimarina pacifica TaxID=1296415 RepID=UPI00046E6594|nr:SRPBCC family protein [Aquimarina pacifica]
MARIYLKTKIYAPVAKVFDLSRSIDFHVQSAQKTKEKAIAGRTSGLIKLNETVTWRGKHFGFYLTHQSKITRFDALNHFTDEMIQGHFKSFKHQHNFYKMSTYIEMVDIIDYRLPCGFLGKIFDFIFLRKYLTKFLTSRNEFIKSHAEVSELKKEQ